VHRYGRDPSLLRSFWDSFYSFPHWGKQSLPILIRVLDQVKLRIRSTPSSVLRPNAPHLKRQPLNVWLGSFSTDGSIGTRSRLELSASLALGIGTFPLPFPGRRQCPRKSIASSPESACAGLRKAPQYKIASILSRWQRRGCTRLRSCPNCSTHLRVATEDSGSSFSDQKHRAQL
jgi:hypothetical protein